MTRRTDWADPFDPDALRGPGTRDADPGRDRRGGTGRPAQGPYDGDRFGDDSGRDRRGSGSYADVDLSGGSLWGDGRDGDGEPGGRGGRAGRGRTGGGGSRGGRGRRRNGFGEPSTGRSAEGEGVSDSSRAEKEQPSGDPAERARAICLRLLTGTPRTRKQLADALRKREIPDEVAEEVLSRFEEVGLIDDGAFADAWVESRHHGRGLARRALARELRTKGVDSTLIDEAVSQLDSEQEETTARELVARKLRATRGLDRDKRVRRLAGMLARKGYSEGVALRIVRQALEEEGEETEFLDGEF
ncbi:recombination regulator RecX [Streptomyces acidiscabies]|uniref:Regulatory protein RecX n=1 Tax=Streptomyces acidiscabies TaxID=42234 RepID=A0A0L0K487_9ACTN|nr:recombination regulator RecX [Streptomyces acidiscabies]KND32631.1 recombinase RecX [Streptomyces acidiscabies]